MRCLHCVHNFLVQYARLVLFWVYVESKRGLAAPSGRWKKSTGENIPWDKFLVTVLIVYLCFDTLFYVCIARRVLLGGLSLSVCDGSSVVANTQLFLLQSWQTTDQSWPRRPWILRSVLTIHFTLLCLLNLHLHYVILHWHVAVLFKGLKVQIWAQSVLLWEWDMQITVQCT